ncbi:MAG: hypothetical protein ACW992_11645 [Candidatus Thorarchaeota archaeon]|jgi:hypothetical protein
MARCAFCDADFETGPGDILLVCPYCGTAQTTDGVKFKDHFMIRVHFDQSESQTTLLDWVSKQLGAPEDLAAKARFIQYVLTSSGNRNPVSLHDAMRSRLQEQQGLMRISDTILSQLEQRNSSVMLTPRSSMERSCTVNWMKTRQERGRRRSLSTSSESQAREGAKKIAFDKQTALIMDEVEKIESRSDNIDVGATYLVHVPVWELEYRYGNSKYKASVAASTGYVIESKYPRSLAFRAMGVGFGLLMLIIGGALVALAQGLIGAPMYTGFGTVSGGILFVLGLVLFYKGVSRKQAKEDL